MATAFWRKFRLVNIPSPSSSDELNKSSIIMQGFFDLDGSVKVVPAAGSFRFDGIQLPRLQEGVSKVLLGASPGVCEVRRRDDRWSLRIRDKQSGKEFKHSLENPTGEALWKKKHHELYRLAFRVPLQLAKGRSASAEINVYLRAHTKLYTANVKFNSSEEASEFKELDWFQPFCKDITDEPEYTDEALARSGKIPD